MDLFALASGGMYLFAGTNGYGIWRRPFSGQQVAMLANAQQDPGYHEIRFDASGLATGVYFYRLTAEGYTSARKLIVLR